MKKKNKPYNFDFAYDIQIPDKEIYLHSGRSSCKKYYKEKYSNYMDNYKDTCLNKFIDICVEWLTKSDLTYWMYALGEKDAKYLKNWFEARKKVLDNE